jgi:hypothetical protein
MSSPREQGRSISIASKATTHDWGFSLQAACSYSRGGAVVVFVPTIFPVIQESWGLEKCKRRRFSRMNNRPEIPI